LTFIDLYFMIIMRDGLISRWYHSLVYRM